MNRLASALAATALLGGSMAVALLAGEGLARLAVNPADFLHATTVSDPILGLRIQPSTTGHDALGFRNDAVPAQVDLVAIGDSMTYGVSASRENSWPAHLARGLGAPVYNMGLGGFGPLQYLHLAQNLAPKMKPKTWVVGFYFGNDLMDAFYVSRGIPHWHGWRVSSGNPQSATEFDQAGAAEPTKAFAGIRDWLSRNSVVYSMLRETVFKRLRAGEQERLNKSVTPDVRMPWNDPAAPGVSTTFTPQFRLAAVDLANAPVREGMDITRKAFSAIRDEAAKQGVRLLVVLIPTKERAYCGYLAKTGATLPASFPKLCEAETRAKAELTTFFKEAGIAHVDAQPALEAGIEKHVQLYPPDSDGHPQGTGYGVIAAEVAAALKRAP